MTTVNICRPHKLRTSRTKAILALLPALAATVVFVMTSRAAGLEVSIASNPSEWAILHDGQTVLIYSFAPWRFKPCVKELAPPGGSNILRDAPHDHLHHHALMFAVAVNGLNFWEEKGGSGVQKPVESPPPQTGVSAEGMPQATIRQTLHWLPPQDVCLPDSPMHALIVEHRTLVLTVNTAAGEVALLWNSTFEVGGRTNTITLTGSSYFGLGMRFLEHLDAVADIFNADGRPDLSDSKQDCSPHAWSAVAFDRPGSPSTVALFGHSSNARNPAVFFTMKRPFAYLSATQALDRKPLVYRAGEKWELNYMVALYTGLKSADAISARGRTWERSKL